MTPVEDKVAQLLQVNYSIKKSEISFSIDDLLQGLPKLDNFLTEPPSRPGGGWLQPLQVQAMMHYCVSLIDSLLRHVTRWIGGSQLSTPEGSSYHGTSDDHSDLRENATVSGATLFWVIEGILQQTSILRLALDDPSVGTPLWDSTGLFLMEHWRRHVTQAVGILRSWTLPPVAAGAALEKKKRSLEGGDADVEMKDAKRRKGVP